MLDRALFRRTPLPEQTPNKALAVRTVLVYDSSGMSARLPRAGYRGIEALAVEVEADVSRCGLAGATVVGLPYIAPKVGIHRVPSAVRAS